MIFKFKSFTPFLLMVAGFCGAEALQLDAGKIKKTARTFYVSPTGNDENPGSAAAPFATIGKAAAAVKPGDTVKIGPGLYREQIILKKSGRKDAPITFLGTRGKSGEYLAVVEAPGTELNNWIPAPEIGPSVWKTLLPNRPGQVLMDGARIVLINPQASELSQWPKVPSEITADMIWDKVGPGSKRLPGLDYLRLPRNVVMTAELNKGKGEQLWPVIGNVLSCWSKGQLYVRFANGEKPEQHRFSATSGDGFTLRGASYLVFRDLFLRGSQTQIRLSGQGCGNTIEKCLLMHGSTRIFIEARVKSTLIRECIMTSGFVGSDFFQQRREGDMRGHILYRVFKNVMGSGHSDDIGVSNNGEGTRILNNVICKGLIGMDAYGPTSEIAGNVVCNMSSVGICTGPRTSGEFHDNLVMNCGIPLRIHNLRAKRAKREEFHYSNLFVQDRNGGSQVFVHCMSHLCPEDRVNFDKSVDEKGKTIYTYKKNPPNPVDAGRIYIYHNTFWGGVDKASWNCAFNVRGFSKRFRMAMPFYVINNIFKDNPILGVKTHELAGPNLLYVFDGTVFAIPRVEPEVATVNRVLNEEESQKIWNKNDLPGLPDLTLAPGSPALEAGIDISRPFTVNGKQYPALPGFNPGYFRGKSPAAGALQQGESMERFIGMFRKAEDTIKMLNGLWQKTAAESKQK